MYRQNLTQYEDLDREIRTLYELGVPEEDIRYLKHLKEKQEASRKWG